MTTGTMYWLKLGTRRTRSRVHNISCRHCRLDDNAQPKSRARIRRENWCGPYATDEEAINASLSLGIIPSDCRHGCV